MTGKQRFLIGGVGAFTPQLLNFLAVESDTTFSDLTWHVPVGYVIRVAILFYLGGMLAFFHKTEHSALKIFQLGIVAPALITGYLNARNVEAYKNEGPPGGEHHASFSLVPPAYAQEPEKEEVKQFQQPNQSPAQQFWRGLTGSVVTRTWFVIIGSHLKLEDAQKQAEQIHQKWPDFKPEVYSPYAGSKYYPVVIGADLPYQQAEKLRQGAIAAGLPKDTYLWAPPR